MTNYRRNFVPGGSYFFTVNLFDRRVGPAGHMDTAAGLSAAPYAHRRCNVREGR
jgi:hypothetical protein